jgi:galactose mutarotase-like enzyme
MNLASRLHGPHKRSLLTRFSMSGRCTPLLIGLLCLILLGASLEFGHGRLHLITAKIDPPVVVPQYPSGPGGQDVLRLSRTANAIGEDPEFLSVTLLPGRGLNVFQIMTLVPGRGDVPLLASPSLANASNVLTGQGTDISGAASTTLGGALLLPWARQLTGTPLAGEGNQPMIQTDWQGQMFRVPADSPGSSTSLEGLLLKRGTDSVQTEVLPDGQSVQAVFHPGSFRGAWPSSLEVTVEVELEAHEINLTMTAVNSGSQPMPLGAGWRPMFVLPGASRNSLLLTIPSTTVTEIDRATMLPTGRTVSVAHTALDFSAASGTLLGTSEIDETYTNLQAAQPGPTAILRDPATDLLLRLTALTPNITNFHVVSPSNRAWISIGPNTNLDDPLGPEWAQHPSGLMTLGPGQSTQWKVRLEIARLGTSNGAP